MTGIRTAGLDLFDPIPGPRGAEPSLSGLSSSGSQHSGSQHSTLPAAAPALTPRPDFEVIQDSREFAELRSRLRRFVFPMSLLFLGWYLTFVLLAAYAHEFMATRVFGLVTVGMVLGVAQFATTLMITFAYNSYARRRLDPQVGLVRDQAGTAGS